MDNTNQQQKRTENEPLRSKTSLETSKQEIVTQESRDYLAAIMSIISKSLSFSLQPPPTPEHLLLQARNWMEFLQKDIPLEELNGIADKAFAEHSGHYPVNAYDIRRAWFRDLPESVRAGRMSLAEHRRFTEIDKLSRPNFKKAETV